MPDARVQAAIDHWASRLITNGVAFNDFQRVTSSLEAWDDWLDAWTAVGDEHRARAEEAAAAGRNVSAAEAYQLAAVCFHFAKFVWVLDTERNKACTRAANECTIAARSLDDPTFERIEDVGLVVVKRDGTKEPFDRDKLATSIGKALTDRPVTATEIGIMVDRIQARLRRKGPEVASSVVGREVLDALRRTDEVAYLRFASVYKEFEGVADFERELVSLQKKEPAKRRST